MFFSTSNKKMMEISKKFRGRKQKQRQLTADTAVTAAAREAAKK